MNHKTAYYHLPGLFECYELYRVFLPLYLSLIHISEPTRPY